MRAAPARRDGLHALVTLGVFALLVLACGLLRDRAPLRDFVPIVTEAARPGPGWYLSYDRGSLDHGVLFHGQSGTAEAMKRVDLLILGSSSTVFAFRHDELAEFFARVDLRHYVMAFVYGERVGFAEAMIRAHDLHPKWVIVCADPFFAGGVSEMALLVQEERVFDAWKRRFEGVVAYEVRHRLHRVLPFFDPFPLEIDWVLFRNVEDGTTLPAAHKGVASPAIPSERVASKRALERWIEEGRSFRDAMLARGARLVLTSVPPAQSESVVRVGEALGVPVIVPELSADDLMTLDGSHLDDLSSRRYTRAFLAGLEEILREDPAPPATAPRAGEQGPQR